MLGPVNLKHPLNLVEVVPRNSPVCFCIMQLNLPRLLVSWSVVPILPLYEFHGPLEIPGYILRKIV